MLSNTSTQKEVFLQVVQKQRKLSVIRSVVWWNINTHLPMYVSSDYSIPHNTKQLLVKQVYSDYFNAQNTKQLPTGFLNKPSKYSMTKVTLRGTGSCILHIEHSLQPGIQGAGKRRGEKE